MHHNAEETQDLLNRARHGDEAAKGRLLAQHREALRRLESRIPDNAPLWLITLLQLALPSEIPGYVLGLVRYRFFIYVLALGLAELPYTLATVYLGASFVSGRIGSILIAGALIAMLSVLAFYAWRSTMRDAQSNAPQELL